MTHEEMSVEHLLCSSELGSGSLSIVHLNLNTMSEVVESQQDSGCFSFLSSPAKSLLDSPCSEKSLTSPTNHSFVEFEFYRSQRKHVDILSQLHDHNAHHLLEEIFCRLAARDLQHCSRVCQRWQIILQEYSRQRQKHTVKRTLFHQPSPTPTAPKETKFVSTPLQTIVNRSSPKRSMTETLETLSTQYGYLKYLHGPTRTKRCPICAFVSVVDVNDQHG